MLIDGSNLALEPNFPHPNPAFPFPPRPGAKWQFPAFVTSVVVALLSILGIAFGYKALEAAKLQFVSMALMGSAALGVLCGFIFLDATLKSRAWSIGRIIPAVVSDPQSRKSLGEWGRLGKELLTDPTQLAAKAALNVVSQMVTPTVRIMCIMNGEIEFIDNVRVPINSRVLPGMWVWFIPGSFLSHNTILDQGDPRVMHCPEPEYAHKVWFAANFQIAYEKLEKEAERLTGRPV